MPLIPAFRADFGSTVQQGQACAGYFDGNNPGMAAGAPGGKVVLHLPFESDADGGAAMLGGAGAGLDRGRARHTRQLNVNRKVTAVVAGHLRGDASAADTGPRDLLLVGSGSSLLAYDPHRNTDAFSKEVSEGVSALLVANLDAAEGSSAHASALGSGAGPAAAAAADSADSEGGAAHGSAESGAAGRQQARTASSLAVAGGNCSLQAFDGAGDEALWTVTGDEVTALETVGTGGGAAGAHSVGSATGKRSLVAASADLEFRFFQGEDVQAEVIETAVATDLCRLDHPFMALPPTGAAAGSAASRTPMARGRKLSAASSEAAISQGQGERMGYALRNGTVGVYRGLYRKWRVKAKMSPMAVGAFDLDADGEVEVVSGWEGGRLEARRADSGQLVYRDDPAQAGAMGASGAGAGTSSSSSSVSALIRCDYRRAQEDSLLVVRADGTVQGLRPVEAEVATAGGAAAEAAGLVATSADVQAVQDLQERKGALEAELRALERREKGLREGKQDGNSLHVATALQAETLQDEEAGAVLVSMRVSHAAHVRSALVKALDSAALPGGQESMMFAPTVATGALRFPLRLERDEPVVLSIQALCGRLRSASQCHVFCKQLRLPRFAMWSFLGTTEVLAPPGGDAQGNSPGPGMGSSFGPSSGVGSGGAAILDRVQAPSGYVQFEMESEEVSRVGLWAQQRFLLPRRAMQTASSLGGGTLSMAFRRLAPVVGPGGGKGGEGSSAVAGLGGAAGIEGEDLPVLTVLARPRDATGRGPGGGGAAGCVVRIGCSALPLATCVAQDMYDWLGVRVMSDGSESGRLVVSLPQQHARVLEAGSEIKEQQGMRLRLSAEAADRSNAIKALVARAEDARLTENVGGLRRSYARLQEVSAELLGEHARRAMAHGRLMGRLKWINECIQRAASLRMGPGRGVFVQKCRGAVKAGDWGQLAGLLAGEVGH